ncbi:MAG TPA: DUF455 domain-containing protein, partial [Cupriavidus sp.]|nr:DUF455 domain-containing protein [Cupriavidus sp.]
MPDIAPAEIADSPLATRRRALAVLCITDARAKAAAARALHADLLAHGGTVTDVDEVLVADASAAIPGRPA